MSLKNWKTVVDVDLTGPFLCAREFAERHIASDGGEGVIVNISSIARYGNQGQSNYSAAKQASSQTLWSGVKSWPVMGFEQAPLRRDLSTRRFCRVCDQTSLKAC